MKKIISSIKVPHKLDVVRQKFNPYQKGFFVYFVILLLLFLTLPLIKLSYIGSFQVDSFGLFNQYMTKSAIIIILTIFFLIAYNSSNQWKYKLHKIFGFSSNSYLTNISGLLIILVALFSISDTVTLIKQSMSPRISTTNYFLVIGIYVIIGITLSAMIARIEHKKSIKTTDVNIKKANDENNIIPGFEQAQKEVDGLFNDKNI